jgi:hypothetical protein
VDGLLSTAQSRSLETHVRGVENVRRLVTVDTAVRE